MLLGADGVSGRAIAEPVGVRSGAYREFASVAPGALVALNEHPKAERKDRAVSAETTERVIQPTWSPPPAGSNRLDDTPAR